MAEHIATLTRDAITHISVVTVLVHDQERALKFYTEGLGFEKRMDMPFGEKLRWLTVAPAGTSTEIVLAAGFPMGEEGAGLPRDGETGVKGTGMVLHTEDCRATYETLSSRGVRFIEEPNEQPWGLQAIFVDPDNNGFVLVQPPSY